MDDFKIKDIERIRLNPGDKLVVTLPEDTTPGVLDFIGEQLRDVFKDNVVLVVTDKMKFKVVGPGEETESCCSCFGIPSRYCPEHGDNRA